MFDHLTISCFSSTLSNIELSSMPSLLSRMAALLDGYRYFFRTVGIDSGHLFYLCNVLSSAFTSNYNFLTSEFSLSSCSTLPYVNCVIVGMEFVSF